MSAKIGVVFWGTKRGSIIFFNSPHLDMQPKEVEKATEDLRSLISFETPKIKYYALSFTVNYKIYTCFQSVVDWGNRGGGYIAVSVLVPTGKKISHGGVTDLLHALLNKYTDNYLEANFKISEQKENQKLFFDIIDTYRLEQDTNSRYKHWQPSQKTEKGLYRHSSVEELKTIFDSPYRNEFRALQKIIFLQKNIPQEKEFYQGNFQSIDQISEEKLYRLNVQISDSQGNFITPNLSVNGVKENIPVYGLYKEDSIIITAKSPHHKPLEINKPLHDLIHSAGNLTGTTLNLKKQLNVARKNVKFILYEKGSNHTPLKQNGQILINQTEDKVIVHNGNAAIQDINPFNRYNLTFNIDGYNPYQLNKTGKELIDSAIRGFAITLTPSDQLLNQRAALKRQEEEKKQAAEKAERKRIERQEREKEEKKSKKNKHRASVGSSQGKKNKQKKTDNGISLGSLQEERGFKHKASSFYRNNRTKIFALAATLLLGLVVGGGFYYINNNGEKEEAEVVDDSFETTNGNTESVTVEEYQDEETNIQYIIKIDDENLKNSISEITITYPKNEVGGGSSGNEIKEKIELGEEFEIQNSSLPGSIEYTITYKKNESTEDNTEAIFEFKGTLSLNDFNAATNTATIDDDIKKHIKELEEKKKKAENAEADAQKKKYAALIKTANSPSFSYAKDALKKFDMEECKNSGAVIKLEGAQPKNNNCDGLKERLEGIQKIYTEFWDDEDKLKNVYLKWNISKVQKQAVLSRAYELFHQNNNRGLDKDNFTIEDYKHIINRR